MHKNIKRLTRTKLYTDDPVLENVKKRTFTENGPHISGKQHSNENCNAVIDEEKRDDEEEIIEKRAISFIDNLGDLQKMLNLNKKSNTQGYQFNSINEIIIKSLQEKDEEYKSFYELL